MFLVLEWGRATPAQRRVIEARIRGLVVTAAEPDLPVRGERRKGDACCYCGVPLIEPPQRGGKTSNPKPHPDERTVDHHLPKSRGGERGPGNGVWCCHGCNQARNRIDLEKDPSGKEAALRAHMGRCRRLGRDLRVALFTRHVWEPEIRTRQPKERR